MTRLRDPTQTFLYDQDYATGKWYSTTLSGTETAMFKSARVQYSSTPLRDISAAITTANTLHARQPTTVSPVPEPAVWQLMLVGIVCLGISRFRWKSI